MNIFTPFFGLKAQYYYLKIQIKIQFCNVELLVWIYLIKCFELYGVDNWKIYLHSTNFTYKLATIFIGSRPIDKEFDCFSSVLVLTSTLSSDVKTVVPCVSTTTSPLRIQETWKIQKKMLYSFREKKLK